MIHEYEKNVQIMHKKYGKGGHRNLFDHFEAYFAGVTHVAGRDLKFFRQPPTCFRCPPTIFSKTYHLTEKFMKT